MDRIEHSSKRDYSGQLVEDGGFYGNGRPTKCGGGSRNSNPIGGASSRNTSPSRQKIVKTKPRIWMKKHLLHLVKQWTLTELGQWTGLPDKTLPKPPWLSGEKELVVRRQSE
ncbi:hypothetical protein S245_063608 [Arachis hypogaea]